MTDDKQTPLNEADALLADTDGDAEADYRAKLPAVARARAMGLSDAEIEEAFGITLKPEDRTG